MKKTLLMAAVLVLAACSKKTETPAADTTSAVTPAPEPAPAPAPAPMNNSMDSSAMPHDTGAMHSKSGKRHSDSTMARDSMAH